MSARYVCPECGTPVVPSGPGRQARCPDCQALLELPFLPRAAVPTRRRRVGRSGIHGWAWVAIAVAVAVAVTALVYLIVRGNIRSAQRRTFETLVVEAEADASAGDWERAVDRLGAAVVLGKAHDLADEYRLEGLDGRLVELTDRRDVARRETIETKAETDLAGARSALGGVKPDYGLAVDGCEAAFAAARELTTPRAQEIRKAARELAVMLVRERGVDLLEPSGKFLDSAVGAATYVERVRPILETHLRGRAYVPARPGSPLAEIWPAEAAYRLQMNVGEAVDREYMESVLPTSRVDLGLVLERGGKEVWHTRVMARTRQPAPNIPYPASAAFATARKRDAKAERRLYDDAIEHLTGQLPAKLATMPGVVVGSPGGY